MHGEKQRDGNRATVAHVQAIVDRLRGEGMLPAEIVKAIQGARRMGKTDEINERVREWYGWTTAGSVVILPPANAAPRPRDATLDDVASLVLDVLPGDRAI